MSDEESDIFKHFALPIKALYHCILTITYAAYIYTQIQPLPKCIFTATESYSEVIDINTL